jgi:hypothetical protein
MSSIDGVGNSGMSPTQMNHGNDGSNKSGEGFGSVMSRVADGALTSVSRLAPIVPGGELVKIAADGLLQLKGSSPEGMPGGTDDQMSQMFEMQKQNQAFNLQYMQLQNELQEDNRRFSTMSNLMKVRHDTAKAAINNMHA